MCLGRACWISILEVVCWFGLGAVLGYEELSVVFDACAGRFEEECREVLVEHVVKVLC